MSAAALSDCYTIDLTTHQCNRECNTGQIGDIERPTKICKYIGAMLSQKSESPSGLVIRMRENRASA